MDWNPLKWKDTKWKKDMFFPHHSRRWNTPSTSYMFRGQKFFFSTKYGIYVCQKSLSFIKCCLFLFGLSRIKTVNGYEQVFVRPDEKKCQTTVVGRLTPGDRPFFPVKTQEYGTHSCVEGTLKPPSGVMLGEVRRVGRCICFEDETPGTPWKHLDPCEVHLLSLTKSSVLVPWLVETGSTSLSDGNRSKRTLDRKRGSICFSFVFQKCSVERWFPLTLRFRGRRWGRRRLKVRGTVVRPWSRDFPHISSSFLWQDVWPTTRIKTVVERGTGTRSVTLRVYKSSKWQFVLTWDTKDSKKTESITS